MSMRIAQLIDTLKTGGAEQLQVTLAEALQGRTDLSIRLVVMGERRESPVQSRLEKLKVPVENFAGENLFDPIRFWRLDRFLSLEKPELLHAHLTYSIILAAAA